TGPDAEVSHCTVALPVQGAPVCYDLRIHLTRPQQGAACWFGLRRGDRGGHIHLDGWSGNPANNQALTLAPMDQTLLRQGKLLTSSPGVRRFLLQVRSRHAALSLDGEEIIRWQGNWADARQDARYFVPDARGGDPIFGIGICGGAAVIHTADIREYDLRAGR